MKKKALVLFLIITLSFSTMGCSLIDKISDYFKEDEIVYTDIDELIRQDLIAYEVDLTIDSDEDGLINSEENDYGTNMFAIDTDEDGLSDYCEINETKTNPLKFDTDNDGLKDGIEIEIGLDPLNKKTNGTNDGSIEFEKEFEIENAKLDVKGNGNIYGIYVNTLEDCNLNNTPGVVSDLYEFYMEDMNFDEATLTIEYDEEVLENSNIEEDNLKIYQLLDDGTFFEVGGKIDEENNTISTKLEHFSKYFVADSIILNGNMGTQVFILLDNSGSMYPPEMCEGSEGNDIDFKRVDMAKQLIGMTDEEVEYGLAKFTGTYTELCGGFNNEKDTLYEKLDNIKVEEEEFNGTYIATSMLNALDNFEDTNLSHKKFLLVLTDGATTESKTSLFNYCSYDESDVIAKANEKNVEIIVIGLGNSVDETYLTSMTDMTSGLYVYANNSNALETVYERITARLNYNYVDLDDNDEFDHIAIADTGFDPVVNGFPLKNYTLKTYYSDDYSNGQCFGIAKLCQLYYKGQLPITNDAIENHKAGGAIAGSYVESIGYDLTSIEFFSDGTNEYAYSKNNLSDFSLFEEINAINEVPYAEKYCRKDTNDEDEKYA